LLDIYFNHQTIIYRVTGDSGFVFQPKLLLYSLLICCWFMKNQFSEVKKISNLFTNELQSHYNYGWIYILITQNQYVLQLVMVAWCVQPKYCFQYFLSVSSKNIVIFPINAFLLNGKSSFRSQKYLKLISLWASIAL